MKNTKEVKAILTAIFAINRTSEHEDKDVSLYPRLCFPQAVRRKY